MTQEYKVGDQSPYIAKIQRMLNEKAQIHLVADGAFGPKLHDAISTFQGKNGMRVTGTYSIQLANLFDPLIEFKYLTASDFDTAAGILGLPKYVIQAVQSVESKSSGYFDDGRADILFERHQFRKKLLSWMSLSVNNSIAVATAAGIPYQPANINATFVDNALILKMGDIYNPIAGGYIGGSKEYDRMTRAAALNESCAWQSASWGLFQIMGYWYQTLGYASVQDMVKDAQTSEDLQLQMFCNFVKADSRMLRALATGDYHSFAVEYNGPAQQGYDMKIASAVNNFRNHPTS